MEGDCREENKYYVEKQTNQKQGSGMWYNIIN